MASRLLVLDIEGTLFQTRIRLPGTQIDSTIWQSLAHRLGQSAIDEEVATHAKWANGSYRNYLDWMRDTIDVHMRHGLTKHVFQEVIDAAEYNEGVIAALSQIDRRKYELVLVSGGFRELAARAQRDLGIRHAFVACEYFFATSGEICGFNLLPCDFRGKIDFIRLMLREYDISDRDWVFVGDGVNDVPIATVAPVSIGYRPHEELRRVVTHVVTSFDEVLPLLP
jgi:phosphoserine phosphatase